MQKIKELLERHEKYKSSDEGLKERYKFSVQLKLVLIIALPLLVCVHLLDKYEILSSNILAFVGVLFLLTAVKLGARYLTEKKFKK
jgi:hypothetical protein